MEEVGKLTQKRINLINGIQNQQETAWGQIDAVLKTQDDAKMLEVIQLKYNIHRYAVSKNFRR